MIGSPTPDLEFSFEFDLRGKNKKKAPALILSDSHNEISV
jgi:hypothetical protein